MNLVAIAAAAAAAAAAATCRRQNLLRFFRPALRLGRSLLSSPRVGTLNGILNLRHAAPQTQQRRLPLVSCSLLVLHDSFCFRGDDS
jgi:hypothetical protein